MKKVLFFLALIIVAGSLSACTAETNESVKNNAEVDNYKINSLESANNNLENNNVGLISNETPIVSNETNATAAGQGDSVANNPMRTLDNQTDLVKEYSQAIFKTSLGNITVKFYGEDSPITVNNFMNLAQSGFYNGTKFHRIITDFMIQGGDPNSKEADTSMYGTGGPGYKFADEFNNHKLVAGSLAMANAGPGTNGSQFFIVTATETPWLDGHHTNFGEVTKGMDIVKKIEGVGTDARDVPTTPVVVNSIELVK